MRSIHPQNFIASFGDIVLEICFGQRTGRRPSATGDPIIRPVFDGRIITFLDCLILIEFADKKNPDVVKMDKSLLTQLGGKTNMGN